MEPAEGEYILPLRDLLRVVWKRLWIIVLVAIIFSGAAVGLSLQQVPIYQASIKILVGQERGLPEDPANALALQQLTQTMAEAISSRPVAAGVVEELDLNMAPEELMGGLSVEPVPETQFIEVNYMDPEPQEAQRIVNTVGKVFSEQISEVSPSASAITATVWEEAITPEAPTSPDPVRSGFLALVLGGFLGLGLVFLLEYLDDSWSSPEEVEQVSGVPTFGVIPEFKMAKHQKKKG